MLIAGIVFFLSNKYNEPGQVSLTSVEAEPAMNELSKTIDEINSKLDSIRDQRSALITDLKTTGEIGSKRDRILKNIFLLNDLINRSQHQIERLNKTINATVSENKLLKEKLAMYENNREDIIRELENVKYELELSEKQNDKLANNLTDQKNLVQRTSAKLNATENVAYTAYYISGDHALLKRLDLLDVRGKDLPIKEFEKVDTRAEAIIPTHAKNVKVLTSHASGSYNWQDDDQGNKNLCIVQPLQFWKNSRYLIIEVK